LSSGHIGFCGFKFVDDEGENGGVEEVKSSSSPGAIFGPTDGDMGLNTSGEESECKNEVVFESFFVL